MVIPNLKFSGIWGGYSGVNFGHPKSEVFQNGGGGLSGLQFQKGAFWKIWTKIYCAARNLLVHHSSLSHTTYVETNKLKCLTFPILPKYSRISQSVQVILSIHFNWRIGGAPGALPPPTAKNVLNLVQFFLENLAKSLLAPPLPGGLAPPPTGNPGSTPDFCFVKEWGQYIMLLCYNLSVSASPPSNSLPNIQNTCYAALQLKCSIGVTSGQVNQRLFKSGLTLVKGTV